MTAVLLLAGCGAKEPSSGQEANGWRDDVAPKALAEAVAEELGEDYWANMEIDPAWLTDLYGISEDMYEEFYGQMPMISTNVDTLVVIKAVPEKTEDVENAMVAYRENLVQDTMQYPMNLPKIQASVVRSFGNYVCFVQLGASLEEALDDTEKAIGICQEMNDRALSVIEKELTE